MKKINTILTLFILFLSFKGYNQAVYTGGERGGYASLSISSQTGIHDDILNEEQLRIRVFPNPIVQNIEVKASSNDFVSGQKVILSIYDLLGNIVQKQEYVITDQTIILNLKWEKMNKGLFLFVFKIGDKQSTQRISYL